MNSKRALYWQIFKSNKRALISLYIFIFMCFISLFAPFLANDRPIFIYHQNKPYFPILRDYTEVEFGGELESSANYLDPYVQELLAKSFVLRAPIPYSYDSIILDLKSPFPTSMDAKNILGTDDKGRDVAARMIYGLRISIAFGVMLSFFTAIIGISFGALQGFYGGKIDLFSQRIIEVWNSIPTLFVIIILSNIVIPNIWWILGIVLMFNWIGLSAAVRAEFLKVRNLEYIKAAKALGLSDFRIIVRHILPNALTSSFTYLPFIMASGIITLGSIDFLGFGLSAQSASLGELLAQGKNNLSTPHLAISSFFIVSLLLSTLVFIGEGVRDAFDPKKQIDL